MLIYKFTNKLNKKSYVGMTTRTFEERTKEHLRHDLTVFDRALKKYGIENFDYEIIIENVPTIENLNMLEQFYIKLFNSKVPRGYNLCDGGNTSAGYSHTSETRAIMSERKADMHQGEENPFWGKKHSEETRRKMSEAWTPERKKANVERLKGLHYTRKVKNVETGEVFNSIKEAAEKYGLKATHITRVCRGKRKRTGGFHWEYVD